MICALVLKFTRTKEPDFIGLFGNRHTQKSRSNHAKFRDPDLLKNCGIKSHDGWPFGQADLSFWTS